ncbi:MAG: diguanylate cyclase [Rhodocyclaceae bacterium]|nr:diguanylate cyclase [Rhodocyclaceae bacterium]
MDEDKASPVASESPPDSGSVRHSHFRPRFSASLTLRLTLVVVCLFLATLWAAALRLSDYQERKLQDLLAAQQLSNVGYVAADIEANLHIRFDALNTLVERMPQGLLADPAGLQNYLGERRAAYVLFDGGLFAVAADGSRRLAGFALASSVEMDDYRNISPFREVIASGRAAVGMPLRRGADGPLAIILAVPVMGADGRIAAILAGVALVGSRHFLEQVVSHRPGNIGDYLVAAPDHGVFVTGSDPAFSLRPLPPPGRNVLHDKAMAGFEGSGLTISSVGVEELSSVRRVPSANWFVVSRMPAQEAFAPARQLRYLIFSTAGLLSLVLGGLTILFVRLALRPLRDAAKAMTAMTLGEAPLHELPIQREDEVGALVHSFNRLLGLLSHEREALREGEHRMRQIFETNQAVKLIIDPIDGRIVDANGAAVHFYGYSREHLLNLFIGDINGESPDQLRRSLLRAVSGEQAYFTFRHRLASGEMRDVEVYSGPVRTDQGILLNSIIHDITERKRAEDSLRLAANVFEHAHEGIIITDVNANIIDVNPTFTEITGYTREQVLGRNPRLLKSGLHDKAFYTEMWRILLQDGFWRGELWNRRANGEAYAELLTLSVVRDTGNVITHFVGVLADITQLKAYQDYLEQMAHHDPLTHLPNRLLLADRLRLALAQSQRSGKLLAVCYIDLDGFKDVNDSLGHEAGDKLLIQAGKRLQATVRAGDTVARLGGDEFVLLLLGLHDMGECSATLDRVLEAIAATYDVEGNLCRGISASIGVALYPLDAADPDILLRHADQAMYEAKQAGRNCYRHFAPP